MMFIQHVTEREKQTPRILELLLTEREKQTLPKSQILLV